MNDIIIIPEIERLAARECIAQEGAVALQSNFAPHFQAFAPLYSESRDVQDDEPKKARTIRLKIKAVRIASDTTRKDMKADLLRRGRAIDGCHAILMQSLVPVEECLDKIEKAEEIKAQAKRQALIDERTAALEPYSATPSMFNLGEMPESQFADLLAGMKSQHLAKLAAKEAEEKARHEAALAAEAERMRIVAENARLAKLADDERLERERVERAASRERIAHDEKIAAERAEAARLAKVEADRRDAAERARRDQERKAREEAQRKADLALAAERAEFARLKAEQEHAVKVEQGRIAAEKAAARRAAAAPDREKVRALADVVSNLDLPELTDQAVQLKIHEQIGAMSRWLVTLSTKIGE
jgi:hypothetical protein